MSRSKPVPKVRPAVVDVSDKAYEVIKQIGSGSPTSKGANEIIVGPVTLDTNGV
jgi:hypothetical protein